MERKKNRLRVGSVLPAAVLAAVFAAEGAGGSFETGCSYDGAGRSTGTFQYRGRGWTAGLTGRCGPDGDSVIMAGLNAPGLSVGHLGDAGLAAETRNPGPEALGRLDERTFYTADLRSVLKSRIGIVVQPWHARVGMVWEAREDLTGARFWVIPVSSGNWCWEILGDAGNLEAREADEGWYPEEPGRPATTYVFGASRLRFGSGPLDAGITILASGGSRLRPGCMTAISAQYADGSWRIRGRAAWAGSSFRDADGDASDGRWGGAADCRYHPATGLRFSMTYRGEILHAVGDEERFADEGSLEAGWKIDHFLVTASVDLNRVISEQFTGDEKTPVRRISGRAGWERRSGEVTGLCVREPEEEWRLGVETAFPGRGCFLLEPAVVFRIRDDGGFLVDMRLKMRMEIGANRIILAIDADDFPRDWHDGPEGSGDFLAELRYVRKLR